MRALIFATIVIFAACTGSPSNGQQQAVHPVAQGAPHSSFTPAFEGQTRAPEALSGVRINAEEIASGLDHPWAIVFLPDGRMLVTERAGRLRVVTREGAISNPVQGLPRVHVQGQGGLLDVVLGLDFATDRMIYWSYAEPRDGGRGTSVARGRLTDDLRRVEQVQVIFRQLPARDTGGHYGSRLVFDRAGHLYITLGERQRPASRVLAQDLSTHLGKIVRINADGSVPPDNPFVGRADALPQNWSYGHRNVQGADLNPDTGKLWIVEHGPRGGDELNIPRAGLNYGWPIIGYGIDYNGAPQHETSAREGMEQPIYYWDPVIAPGDMDFYRGGLFPWRGDVLIAGLDTQALVRLDIDGERVTGEERFALGVGRIRDLAESEDGAIWIVTDEDNGRILRLTPQS
ncbi:PQQ-dependent sugar dehydrogenase [Candidatus Viadribacter manganicus]|uniref:Glucose dehydrogenase n=1 Tax=Candidatus Viadribacter manganicus TaxID=1759059 RepID=A0A1B1AHB2_9PROT|nr:PQQ-dependent sugar dehydrogenase [Candidatus Viadribacter manganicus]ANP45945.1 glucose dehydrogenase [Candidatus Viadribacter manganicus]